MVYNMIMKGGKIINITSWASQYRVCKCTGGCIARAWPWHSLTTIGCCRKKKGIEGMVKNIVGIILSCSVSRRARRGGRRRRACWRAYGIDDSCAVCGRGHYGDPCLVMWHPGANANVSHVIDLHAQYFFFQPLLSSIVLARMVGLLLPAHPLTSQETEGYVY